jgi:hypothetical protein
MQRLVEGRLAGQLLCYGQAQWGQPSEMSGALPCCGLGGCTHCGANVPRSVVVHVMRHQHYAHSVGDRKGQVHQ